MLSVRAIKVIFMQLSLQSPEQHSSVVTDITATTIVNQDSNQVSPTLNDLFLFL